MKNLSYFDLQGRVAVVTGGNGGLGLGMARGLAKAGARIAVAGRNAAKSRAAIEELTALGTEAIAIDADVLREADCRALVDRAAAHFGRLDVLINNAGISVRKRPEDLSAADWHRVIDSNLSSALFCAQAAHPHFKRAGGGKVVSIASIFALLGAPHTAAYGASKGGIVQLTRSLAAAWAADNIQVNALLPGYVHTEMTDRAQAEVPGLNERVLARTMTGRWGEPSDFEAIAVLLAGSGSQFITGAAIPVDGGYSIQA